VKGRWEGWNWGKGKVGVKWVAQLKVPVGLAGGRNSCAH